jgi:membrane-associated phospholipid phosphatase
LPPSTRPSNRPSTRSRNRLIGGAAVCLLVVVALSVLVKLDLGDLDGFDTWFGTAPQAWTVRHDTALRILDAIELAFDTIPMTIYTLALAGGLAARNHRRAAVWLVGVMLGASLTTYFLKRFFQRDRPVWEDPVHQLNSFAFPSGHSSGIAAAMGIAIVLTVMLVRRRGLRRGLVSLWVFLIVLVGADRILLGVHHLSDVVAGYAVGFFWVLLGMVLYHPAPRSRALEQFVSPVPSNRQLAVVLNPVKV